MQQEMKHKSSILFPSILEVYRYSWLWWIYHCEDLGDTAADDKWESEVYDIVLKVYNYEKYNRVMQEEDSTYEDIYDAIEYFVKIGNEKAYKNMAWILKLFDTFNKDYQDTLIKEDYKRADVLKHAFNLNSAPDFYLIEFDETFLSEKDNIIKDIEFLEQEQKRREPDKDSVDDEVNEPKGIFDSYYDNGDEYIILGMFDHVDCIAESMIRYQNDKDILYFMILSIDVFNGEYANEVVVDLKRMDKKNILNTITRYVRNKKKQAKYKPLYFSKVYELLKKHKKIGNKVLVELLHHYEKDSNKQQNILNLLDEQTLLKGINYANEIEYYEISQLIYLFIKQQVR